MAHVKSAGATANQKENVAGKRLGLKVGAGQIVEPGMILVRQRGTKYYPGKNTKLTRNFDIVARIRGKVVFGHIRRPHGLRTVINVVPV